MKNIIQNTSMIYEIKLLEEKTDENVFFYFCYDMSLIRVNLHILQNMDFHMRWDTRLLSNYPGINVLNLITISTSDFIGSNKHANYNSIFR